jgi:hypothetical protein
VATTSFERRARQIVAVARADGNLDEARRAHPLEEWTQALRLNDEQAARLGPLVDQYIREVDAERAATEPEADSTGLDRAGTSIDARRMLVLQRRMANELGLNKNRMGRLMRMDDATQVRYRTE